MILQKVENKDLTSDEKVVLEMLLNNCISTRHSTNTCFGQLKELWNNFPNSFKYINIGFTEVEHVMIMSFVSPLFDNLVDIKEEFEISLYDFITKYDKDLKKLEDLFFYDVLF